MVTSLDMKVDYRHRAVQTPYHLDLAALWTQDPGSALPLL